MKMEVDLLDKSHKKFCYYPPSNVSIVAIMEYCIFSLNIVLLISWVPKELTSEFGNSMINVTQNLFFCLVNLLLGLVFLQH